MCKAYSKVTHIKQRKYFNHLKLPVYKLSITSFSDVVSAQVAKIYNSVQFTLSDL